MRKLFASVFVVSALLSVSASALTAEQSIAKEVQTVDASGNTVVTYEPAILVVPGETVVYRLDYENNGVDPVSNMVLTMPVPKEILFQDGSAHKEGTTTVFSVDKAASFTSRDGLIVEAVGQDKKPADAADITHIRWMFEVPLQPGEAGQLSFKGVLK